MSRYCTTLRCPTLFVRAAITSSKTSKGKFNSGISDCSLGNTDCEVSCKEPVDVVSRRIPVGYQRPRTSTDLVWGKRPALWGLNVSIRLHFQFVTLTRQVGKQSQWPSLTNMMSEWIGKGNFFHQCKTLGIMFHRLSGSKKNFRPDLCYAQDHTSTIV